MPARRRRTPAADACEPLEVRRLLTTFTVTDGGDATDAGDGVLTFREALAAANDSAGADAIDFAPRVGVVTLAGDLRDLTDGFQAGDLAIDGGTGVTIDHAGFRGMELRAGSVSIAGLTFVGARSGDSAGAALLVSGADVTLRDVNFLDNVAAGGSGGAVAVVGGSVAMTGGTFESNLAARGGAIAAVGGTASVALTDVRGISNAADGGGGFLFFDDGATAALRGGYLALNSAGNGGAVYGGRDAAALDVDGTTFSTNAATGRFAYGGAIDYDGEGPETAPFENAPGLTIADALFFRNEATGRDEGYGGAVAVSFGEAVVTGAAFARNVASSEGGAVYAFSELSFTDARFVANRAGDAGGAVMIRDATARFEGGRIAQNRAVRRGGAIGAFEATVRLTDLAVNRNRVTDGGGDFNGGGAVHLNNDFDASLRADRVRFARNAARGAGDRTAGGGAIHGTVATVRLRDSVLAANSADGAGGAVRMRAGFLDANGTTFRGNAARTHGGAVAGIGFDEFDGEWRGDFDGGAFVGNTAKSRGGAVWASAPLTAFNDGDTFPNAIVQLNGVRVRGNAAADGAGVFLNRGGDLDARGGTLFRANRATGDGGAVRNGGAARLRETRFVGNRADAGAAVLTSENGRTVLVADLLFRGNVPDDFAGPGRLADRT